MNTICLLILLKIKIHWSHREMLLTIQLILFDQSNCWGTANLRITQDGGLAAHFVKVKIPHHPIKPNFTCVTSHDESKMWYNYIIKYYVFRYKYNSNDVKTLSAVSKSCIKHLIVQKKLANLNITKQIKLYSLPTLIPSVCITAHPLTNEKHGNNKI